MRSRFLRPLPLALSAVILGVVLYHAHDSEDFVSEPKTPPATPEIAALRGALSLILASPLPKGSPQEAAALAQLDAMALRFDQLGDDEDARRARKTAEVIRSRPQGAV